MQTEPIRDQVIKIIAEKLHIDTSRVTDSATLQELGADSLDMVEIIMRMEEQFEIEINDEEAEKLHNVGEVINYIVSLKKK